MKKQNKKCWEFGGKRYEICSIYLIIILGGEGIKLKQIEKRTYNHIYKKIIINQCADNKFWRENIFYIFKDCFYIYPQML